MPALIFVEILLLRIDLDQCLCVYLITSIIYLAYRSIFSSMQFDLIFEETQRLFTFPLYCLLVMMALTVYALTGG